MDSGEWGNFMLQPLSRLSVDLQSALGQILSQFDEKHAEKIIEKSAREVA